MTKHATKKDCCLKCQLVVSTSESRNSGDTCSEKVWPSWGFVREKRSDFGMDKVNYPENTLLYINQAHLTTQKGESILYADHFISDQIISVNVLNNVENCKCWSDDVKIISPLCDVSTGDFKEFDEIIGFLSVRGDFDITFFNYGYNKERSMVV